jgi:hypothetical protein
MPKQTPSDDSSPPLLLLLLLLLQIPSNDNSLSLLHQIHTSSVVC